MNLQKIEKLVEKYEAGKTSLQEEQLLQTFFLEGRIVTIVTAMKLAKI